MKLDSYFYNCPTEYIHSIDAGLHNQVLGVVEQLPKWQTKSEINTDLFWLLTTNRWNYDTVPTGAGSGISERFGNDLSLNEIKQSNDRKLSRASTTLNACGGMPTLLNHMDRSLYKSRLNSVRLRPCLRTSVDSG